MDTADRHEKKVYISLPNIHCKSSAIYCSQTVRGLEAGGYVLTRILEDADVIICNTCGIVQDHEDISLSNLTDALRRKKNTAEVISTGCLNEINRRSIEALSGEIRILEEDDVVPALTAGRPEASEADPAAYVDESFPDRISMHGSAYPLTARILLAALKPAIGAHRLLGYPNVEAIHLPQLVAEMQNELKLYVQIGSGCVGACAYCAVRISRGSPRSRSIEAILADIQAGRRRQRSVNFVATDCASWGTDIGSSLHALVGAVHERFPDLGIDLSYVNPAGIERDLDGYREMFARYRINSINICVQSGSQAVLDAMNRRYRIETILRFIDFVKEVSPQTLIWTSLMVGYPGETWRDFFKTIRAARRFHFFEYLSYSPRPGTPSAELEVTSSGLTMLLRKKLLGVQFILQLFFKMLRPRWSKRKVSGEGAA